MRNGDIVARISYGRDIIFKIDRIIKLKNKDRYAVLKGVTVRIEADAPLCDIEKVNAKTVSELERKIEETINQRINNNKDDKRNIRTITGKILHLDGDKRYSEKSARYYKKMGLNAVVKNVPENRQAYMVRTLLEKYKPDILVITRA